MKQIEIEDDLYKYILANIEAFGETPSQILRRLLSIPAEPAVVNRNKQNKKITNDVVTANTIATAKTASVVDKKLISNPLLPEYLAHGVEALFAHNSFKTEPIITNKFKMMLTSMYYENRGAFIEAAKVAKGRFRYYLGENLNDLLLSDNEEELALLVASKPREIPYTPFWVVTNANTGRKRIILTQVMASMGYPHHLIERIQNEI